MMTIPTHESPSCEFKSDRKCLPDRELIEAAVCIDPEHPRGGYLPGWA